MLCSKLRQGAPFLLYLYYRFDNRPIWFRLLWKCTDIVRQIVSKMPFKAKYLFSSIIALLIYFPLARLSLILERLGMDVENFPLSVYRSRSFYTMRTDAFDRFGTRLEKRFTRVEIEQMMRRCGLVSIRFKESAPFWVAVGFKR